MTFLVLIIIIKNNHVNIRLKTLRVHTKFTPNKFLILQEVIHLLRLSHLSC